MNVFPLLSLIIKTSFSPNTHSDLIPASEIPRSQTRQLSQEAVESFFSFVVQSPLIRNQVSFLGFVGV
ncbi:hypothetical protein HanOQP8_Chr12g0462691 [Helianthus annuus]|nr:hypothetical protein HanLR1_Chr12g0463471 [Helianthus annuus]KAJ0679707.1 hypothetical protein HanOQP8_Chr12g0462691 [Helianthus annuus]